MSKENNLTDFLTDVASAIKDKRGIGSVNAQDFSTEIRAIEPLLDTLDITENGLHDVKDYKNVSVLVESEDYQKLKALIERTNSTKFEVPYGIEKIGTNSLIGFSEVYLPNTITKFEKSSIAKDNSIGNTIYFNGTFDEYILIEKGHTIGNTYNGFSGASCRTYIKNENDSYISLSGDVVLNRNITHLPIGALANFFPAEYENTPALNLIVPNTIKEIGIGAFHRTARVNSIVFEEGSEIETIPLYCFYSTNVTEKVTSKRGKIVLPKCKYIEQRAFAECMAGEIVVKEGLEIIRQNAFNNSKIEKIVLPSTLSTIENGVFSNCQNLLELTIPANVTTIGNTALTLGSSSDKATITMESETPCTITTNTFSKSNLNKIYVPKGASATYKVATNWSNYASYIFEKYAVVFNVPSALLNNENVTYSIDGGKTYQQFTNGVLSLNEVATIKIKSTDSSQTIIIGTSAGGSDIGTISNSELTFSFTTDTNVYLTIQ